MSREIIQPNDREHWLALRSQDVTSTTAPALFGLSRHLTAFTLWHALRGNLPIEHEDNAATKWGRRLEAVIANGIAEDEGWNIRPKKEYVRLPDARIGSSFDFETDAPALLEIKSVSSRAFRDGWIETDFGLEAPPAIELQAQVQMLVSGIRECFIGALVDNFTVHILRREFDDVVGDRILAAVAAFWASTKPPEPNYAHDLDTIKRLHGYSCKGKVIDADEETTRLLADYHAASVGKRIAEDEMDAAKAKILMRIGDAEKVLSPIGNLSTFNVAETDISYHRQAYRGWRFNPRSIEK